ncbi:MAG: polyamine aminopropyltransferase [bacterium]|nr:polyamine aminopropyltransferase [bacterium]
MTTTTTQPTYAGERAAVTPRERATLLAAVLIISICAITYELIVGTLSSYLLGDSVTQFSFTIGFFLFAMGIGALFSRRIQQGELRWFIIVELLTGLFGGISASLLYAVFAISSDVYTYYLAMIGITLALGICIGLEIPLLTRIVAHRAELSKALADIFSIDYLGALIASLAFPLLLLPALGVVRTAFLMGLFNIVIAMLCLRLFQGRLSREWGRRLWIGAGGVLAVMITGTILSASILDFFEQQLYSDRIIFREQSTYQRLVITRNNEDVRLFLDGNLQFSSRDEYRYHEMLVHPVMSAARSRETVLVLGGGDGFVAREVLKYDDVQRVIVVDLDPEITDLARNNLLLTRLNGDALDDSRVEVVNGDAYRYLEDSSDLYPVVIIDLPDPNNEGLSKLYSREFYRLLRQHMTPDGVFVTQAASPYFVREAYWMIANTIEAEGFHIVPLHTYVPSFGDWGFVIGRLYPGAQVEVPADIPLRYLTPDVLTAALVFDPDIARLDTDINTLDHPVLPRAYALGWRQWD